MTNQLNLRKCNLKSFAQNKYLNKDSTTQLSSARTPDTYKINHTNLQIMLALSFEKPSQKTTIEPSQPLTPRSRNMPRKLLQTQPMLKKSIAKEWEQKLRPNLFPTQRFHNVFQKRQTFKLMRQSQKSQGQELKVQNEDEKTTTILVTKNVLEPTVNKCCSQEEEKKPFLNKPSEPFLASCCKYGCLKPQTTARSNIIGLQPQLQDFEGKLNKLDSDRMSQILNSSDFHFNSQGIRVHRSSCTQSKNQEQERKSMNYKLFASQKPLFVSSGSKISNRYVSKKSSQELECLKRQLSEEQKDQNSPKHQQSSGVVCIKLQHQHKHKPISKRVLHNQNPNGLKQEQRTRLMSESTNSCF